MLNIAPTIVATSALSAMLGVKSEHTIKNYINYMKQAYLLVGVQKFSSKSKLRVTQEKIYPIDVALLNQRDNAFVGDNLGWRLEAVVLLQLIRTYKPKGYSWLSVSLIVRIFCSSPTMNIVKWKKKE